jgi:hypothetical protein
MRKSSMLATSAWFPSSCSFSNSNSRQLTWNVGTLCPVLYLSVLPVARIICHSVICLCLFILAFSERPTGQYRFHLAPSNIPKLQQIRLKHGGKNRWSSLKTGSTWNPEKIRFLITYSRAETWAWIQTNLRISNKKLKLEEPV